MDLGIKDKVVFVSGGAGDIGSCIVNSFVQQGCKVIIGDMDMIKARKLASGYPNNQVAACFLDVTSEESVRQAVDFVKNNFGKLNVLVNTAGILCRKSFFDATKEDFDKSFAVNVTGLFLLSQGMVSLMKEQGSGAIINISSINGKLAIENRIVYGPTKGAVNLLTQSMALELAPYNITVNAVAPGIVDSKMARVRLNTHELRKQYASAIPLNRLSTPEDVANCVVFLSSPYANYISGEIILVDGGLTARQALPKP